MKKISYILTIITVALISCNDNLQETLVDVNNLKTIKITDDSTNTKFKVRGDNKYDALGFSFDATGEYLDKMSTILPVIDVEALQANTGLVISDDPVHTVLTIEAGSDAKTLLLKYNRKFSVGGAIPIEGIPFTGSLSSEINGSSTVAAKYSYAMANMNAYISHHAIKKYTDVSILQNYLTQSFKNDLLTKTPEQIVSMYGTHVYTDIYTGGSLRFKYKSNIKNSTKESSVAYGATLGIGKATGTNLSVSSSTAITVTDNSVYQLQNMSYESVGGDGGASILGSWSPDAGTTPTINFNQWSSTVKKTNPNSLQLIDVGDQSLMAIYEFVADPAKRAAIKAAVDNHILGESFKIVPVVPLYMYKNSSTSNHFYTTDWSEMGNGSGNWDYVKIAAFVCENQLTNTVPFYRFYRVTKVWFKSYYNHYYTTVRSSGSAYDYEKIQCYIYPDKQVGTTELYQYWNSSKHDHYYSTNDDTPSGYGSKTTCGYVY